MTSWGEAAAAAPPHSSHNWVCVCVSVFRDTCGIRSICILSSMVTVVTRLRVPPRRDNLTVLLSRWELRKLMIVVLEVGFPSVLPVWETWAAQQAAVTTLWFPSSWRYTQEKSGSQQNREQWWNSWFSGLKQRSVQWTSSTVLHYKKM